MDGDNEVMVYTLLLWVNRDFDSDERTQGLGVKITDRSRVILQGVTEFVLHRL